MKGHIHRFRNLYPMNVDYTLISTTAKGYRLNPKLNIMTDLKQFESYWLAAQKTTSTAAKIDLLKKAKRKLPRGIREKGNGSYEARATVNGIKISICGKDLDKLIIEFDSAKEQAKNGANNLDITLNEWFEQWFETVKKHRIKETSIAPMKNSFKRTFGFYIGTMRLRDIKALDVQQAVNAMDKAGVSNGSLRDALGRLRECMDFAIGNQLITYNPCLIVEVPWVYKQSKEEIALTQEEQNAMLDEVEDSWYKEMFYFLCLTGVRVGELGGLKWEDIDFSKKVISIRRSLSCTYCNGEKKY